MGSLHAAKPSRPHPPAFPSLLPPMPKVGKEALLGEEAVAGRGLATAAPPPAAATTSQHLLAKLGEANEEKLQLLTKVGWGWGRGVCVCLA